ncbi:spinster family MFS transporter [Sphingorhabdus sp. M41]|uniref:spinster family MFS transporter n=1 Tax=Sphingorhabdus sp. M41 TaxID=1806885 RepID=UPI00078C7E2F|nr:MFS transporter [Sphingorhabdus sp. M41]AMO70602.1 hypothetical protein AZE99_00915 [Sphingorhabdus sp. M41]
MNPSISANTERAIPSLSRRTWVLLMAMLVGATSYMDRQILTMLVEPIRREFDLTDQQLGLLTGLAFAMIYTITAIPAARLADRWSRRGVVSIAIATWSAMTVVCGLATNFWQLFLARVGVGFGEAGGSAPMQALLADYFPRRQRGTAMSIYLLGAPIGMGLGLAFAGWAVVEYGWRWTFILAGIPGLIIAPLLMLTVKEVRAGMADGISQKFDQPPFGKTIAALWGIRSLPLMMLAATLMALIGMGLQAWVPAFLERTHGLPSTEIGAKLGAALATGSVLGHLSGGPLADFLGRKDLRWHLWTPIVTGALAVLMVLLALNGPANLAFPFFGIQVFLTGLFAAPMLYMATTLAPVWARATSAACAMFAINLVGLGLGPVFIGQISDLLRPIYGEESLRFSLMLALTVYIPAAICFGLASRTYRKDHDAALADLERDSEPGMGH